MKHLIFFLTLVVGCGSQPEPEPIGEMPSIGHADQVMVCIVTYHNPSLSEAGARAEEALFTALQAVGIQPVSAGSRGFSLNVRSEVAERAREIVLEVVAREDLEAWVAPE